MISEEQPASTIPSAFPARKGLCAPSGDELCSNTSDYGFSHLFQTSTAPRRSPGIPFAFPLTAEPTPIDGIRHCSATLDRNGRLSNRSAIQFLKWIPGQPLSFDTTDGLIIVRCAEESRWSLRPTGHLVLPAEVRHSCDLYPGDQLLMTALPSCAHLVIYPTRCVAQALWAYRPSPWRPSP